MRASVRYCQCVTAASCWGENKSGKLGLGIRETVEGYVPTAGMLIRDLSGDSTGEIIGSTAGMGVLVLILASLAFRVYVRKKKQQQQLRAPSTHEVYTVNALDLRQASLQRQLVQVVVSHTEAIMM